jgi:4-amino-4-deoxychorismate lyase
MSRLFESIRVVDGAALHLDYHNARMNRSRRELFGCTEVIELRDVIHAPHDLGTGVYKCRVGYAETIEQIEFVPYQRKEVRSLTLVESDSIEYPHKFTDRACIDLLLKSIRTDDVLIVKGGRITDTSIANIVFSDGSKWVTPSTPLLPGTARARLLDIQAIVAEDVKRTDLRYFKKAVLINAMFDLDDMHAIEIDNIV